MKILCKLSYLLTVLSLLLLPGIFRTASAQKQIYTRTVRLKDFTAATTKVVLGTCPALDECLRQEVVSRWYVSPYEFCSAKEFESLKKNNSMYFLVLEESEGIVFLRFFKGGDPASEDQIKTPLPIMKLAVAVSDRPLEFAPVLIPAYLDVMQDHAEKSMSSAAAAYGKEGKYKSHAPSRYTRVSDPAEAVAAMEEGRPDTVCEFVLNSADGRSYEIKLGADTHKLWHYAKRSR